ncbi:HAD-IIB family hydrolase [Escherichia coli]|nr:HAD-IIB family hydrolase [Escherichia coli]
MARLAAFDMDGTLLMPDHHLGEKTLSTLARLRERDITLTFATGRHALEMQHILGALSLDAYLITGNGTRVHSLEGELLHRDDLPADVAELVLYQQWDTRASMHIFNDDGWFTGKEIPALLQAFVYSGFRYQIIDVKKMPLGRVTKICFCGGHDDLTRLQIQLYEALGERAHLCFSDTVASNIALGCPNATQQEIEHVARLASVHDDILRLPQGYDTEVGERGVMLSGGQKQRISIARALLVNAEILILDDALSAVDGRTEHQILHNLRQWGQGRTVIISAHRLSALTEASEIIVMQHGHIAQRGNHDELAQQSGWYRDMYRYQQLEAALDDAPEIREEAVDA